MQDLRERGAGARGDGDKPTWAGGRDVDFFAERPPRLRSFRRTATWLAATVVAIALGAAYVVVDRTSQPALLSGRAGGLSAEAEGRIARFTPDFRTREAPSGDRSVVEAGAGRVVKYGITVDDSDLPLTLTGFELASGCWEGVGVSLFDRHGSTREDIVPVDLPHRLEDPGPGTAGRNDPAYTVYLDVEVGEPCRFLLEQGNQGVGGDGFAVLTASEAPTPTLVYRRGWRTHREPATAWDGLLLTHDLDAFLCAIDHPQCVSPR